MYNRDVINRLVAYIQMQKIIESGVKPLALAMGI